MMITTISILLVSLNGYDLETSATAVIACINNIGPGFGMVGATGNYSAFSEFSKIVLSFDMLVGRLEVYPMLILFIPSVWRKV
jgi:trk system potassium uptake protein TrkH